MPSTANAQQTLVLYDQDFENPAAYSTSFHDFYKSQDGVNENYANQPSGFRYAQDNTVEVLNVTGSRRGYQSPALGDRGWRDPTGKGGEFAIGMLSHEEDDRLGLAFDLQGRQFLNVSIDFSSIDVVAVGQYVQRGTVPRMRLTLYDNPSGRRATRGTRKLASETFSGTASRRDTFEWTTHRVALDASGATNGKVILQIDLLKGGYAAFDNLAIAASDAAHDLGQAGDPRVLGGSGNAEAQIIADRLVEFKSSGLGPIPGAYGIIGDKFPIAVEPEVATRVEGDGALSLPEGSSLIVCFSNHVVVDKPGPDLTIVAPAGGAAKAAVFVSDGEGITFTYVGQLRKTGDHSDELWRLPIDLAETNAAERISRVKVIGQDLGGNSPGFEVAYISTFPENALAKKVDDGSCSVPESVTNSVPKHN